MKKITVNELNCPECGYDVQEIVVNQEISFCCVNCELHFEVKNREIVEE